MSSQSYRVSCHSYIFLHFFFYIFFKDQLKSSHHCGATPLILFDYHVLCKGGKKDKLEVLKKKADPYLNAFGVFVRKGEKIIRLVQL